MECSGTSRPRCSVIQRVKASSSAALPSRHLAIALNGRIATVAKLFEKTGQLRFQAIVPPDALNAEGNTVEFYAIAEAGPNGEAMRLFPLGSSATTPDASPSAR